MNARPEAVAATSSTQQLRVWLVYEPQPKHPKHYVARLLLVSESGAQPTRAAIKFRQLEQLRRQLQRRGLSPYPRDNEDEAAVIERWM